MTNETIASAPETPAASLLFQAPTFQAPVFKAAPAEREDSPASEERPVRSKSRRKSQTKEAASSKSEESTQGVEAPKDEAPSETPTRKRRQRRLVNSKSEQTPSESASQAQEVHSEESASSHEGESLDGEQSMSTRRRRRRRSRPTLSASDEGDPADQVKALKGSTRLEAKKLRRKEGRREGRRHHGITESEFLARRESVKREMLIRDENGLDQIAILEDGLLVEHYVARRTLKSMVGNIYLGRVQNVLPSMEAAFVDIGRGRNAVLYAGEVNWDAVGLEGKPRRIESALKSGDPVLVQVTKDPIGHKGARLTSQITLAGRYLVLIPNGSMMGISRKLPDSERSRLKKLLKAVVPSGSGVIVRTAAEGATEEQIRDDVERLTRHWADIEKKRSHTKSAPVLLRGEPELALRVVRDIFNEDFTSLVVQGAKTFATVKEYVDELSPDLSERVEQWVGTEDVFHANRVDEQLAKGMDRKVWLPSGGTLIIDRTEAMTVIDVNTGKYIGAGGTLEETVTKNNLEAAEEIVRQLRLRDIGGIIIVDFVDMVLEENRDLVLRRLVECLSRDRTRHQVTEITSLGLVQMTRKRVGEGLVEAFSTPCEACEGRGFIVHDHPVEATGAHDHTGQSAKHNQREKSDARREKDEAEHESAKKALSAIAAASRKVDGEGAHSDKASSTHSAPSVSSRTEHAQGQLAETSSQVTPVAAEVKSPASAGGASEMGGSSTQSPTGASKTSSETAPKKKASSQKVAPKKRRRRAATSEALEPESSTPSISIELPPRSENISAPSRVRSADEIELPERSSTPTPPTKRRRRVASTGVVDLG